VLGCCALALVTHGSARPDPTPAPSLPALSTAPPAATASPAPAGTTTPSIAPTPTYRYVFVPSPAPAASRPDAPRIREIDLTDSVLYAPGDVHVRVLTNDAVVSVTAGAMGRDIEIPALSSGVFAYDGYIPNVPDFVRNRVFEVNFVASSVDGRASTVTLSLTLK